MFCDIKKLQKLVTEKIDTFHSVIEYNKVKSTIWEEILYSSLKELGFIVNWNPNSHSIGKDLEVENPYTRISCKSGKIIRDAIRFSSFRTTRLQTIEEKQKFFEESHQDYIFSLVEIRRGKYNLILIDDKSIDFSTIKWERTTSGWKGVGNFDAKIVEKASHQLWFDFPLKSVDYILEVGNGIEPG